MMKIRFSTDTFLCEGLFESEMMAVTFVDMCQHYTQMEIYELTVEKGEQTLSVGFPGQARGVSALSKILDEMKASEEQS